MRPARPERAALVRRRVPAIAVALHDVEPATYERCALIRDWLTDHGIDRVTLLVIPAPDLHPFADRRPEMVDWLDDCIADGDAIAQHGFQHRQTRPAPWARQRLAALQGRGAAEFVGLPEPDARRAVDAGRTVLRRAGLEPRGFVAPAYAYTPALRRLLDGTYAWWAGVGRLHACGDEPRASLAPVLGFGTTTLPRRLLSPLLVRAGARASGSLLRLDLHPSDLDHPRHIGAVESVLRRARRRVPVTYDELAAA
jgi:predicted deacetylase